jgi:hypothetical protein
MKIFIELLVVVVLAVILPMGICEVTFPMGGLGSSICGHNGWIQVFLFLAIGIAIAIAREGARRKLAQPAPERSMSG